MRAARHHIEVGRSGAPTLDPTGCGRRFGHHWRLEAQTEYTYLRAESATLADDRFDLPRDA